MNGRLPLALSASDHRLIDLVSAACDERITAEELLELQTLVLGDVRACNLYVRLMYLHGGLHQYASVLGSVPDVPSLVLGESVDPDAASLSETMVMPAIRVPVEPQIGAWETEAEGAPVALAPVARPAGASGPGRRRMWMAGLAAALVVGASVPVLRTLWPRSPIPTVARVVPPPAAGPFPVATVVAFDKAIWEPGVVPGGAKPVTLGQTLRLRSGVVELQLAGGGRLVLEGPVQVRFLGRSEVTLDRGTLAATIPGGGFTVRCPAGSVVDLGTQFGVCVGSDGSADVEVFQGRVMASLVGTTAGQTRTDLVLSAGQAAVLSEHGVSRSPAEAVPQRFVRRLSTDDVGELDVTDLISGGDGTTRRRGFAVDATRGRAGRFVAAGIRPGDGRYHPVVGFPVIDGAFVPDGTRGDMTVDSAGDRYLFPRTSNRSVNHIWTGGITPWVKQGIPMTIGGVDYSTADHSNVCIHSNNAITLDLSAVRRLYPGRPLARFRCNVGTSYTKSWPDAVAYNPHVGAFVLVNGAGRFADAGFTSDAGNRSIDVALSPTDRFLTLATTDGGDSVDDDWVLWTDAKLFLGTAAAAAGP